MPALSPVAISLEGVELGYAGVQVVRHLDLRIEQGGRYALVGPNGAGKTTLLKTLAGLIKPSRGKIRLAPGPIGYLPQQNAIAADFPISVFELAAMGLWGQIGVFGGLTPVLRRRVLTALAQVGMQDCAQLPIGALSGGQLQRVLFGRLWLQDPHIILLDEPFNAIDSKTCGDLLQQINDWQQDGRTVLAVLHDLDLVRAHFPYCVLLAHQLVGAGPSQTVLSAGNLQQARQMCEAFDRGMAVPLRRLCL